MFSHLNMQRYRDRFYCSPPGISLRQFYGMGNTYDIKSWIGNQNVFFYHKAKVAIKSAFNILELPKGSEVLVPSYNGGGELDAIIKSGVSVIPYRIDQSATVDITDLQRRITRKTKVIFVIHYFGFPQPIIPIKQLCMENKLFLIEDCALSLLSDYKKNKLGSFGDISLFSFPKTLPLPDGGALVINNSFLKRNIINNKCQNDLLMFRKCLPLLKSGILRTLSQKSIFYPLYKGIAFLLRIRELLPKEKIAYSGTRPLLPSRLMHNEQENDQAMSSISMRILKTFDMDQIKRRRRQNYCHLLNRFSGLDGIKPLFKELPEGICPINFPIIVKDRESLREKLAQRSIDVGAWWKGYHPNFPYNDFPDACFLKDNILTLPIHQDLDENGIEYIAAELISLVKEQG